MNNINDAVGGREQSLVVGPSPNICWQKVRDYDKIAAKRCMIKLEKRFA